MDDLYVTIATFTIKITFKDITDDDAARSHRSEFITNMSEYFEGFEEKDEIKKVNFYIDFEWRDNVEILIQTKRRKFFTEIFTFASKKRIRTFYDLNTSQLELIIRDVIQSLLSKSSGFLLHASSVIVNNTAYLFMGDAGAGKSTSMSLLRDVYKPLSDDILIVKKEKGTYFLYESPFIEKNYTGRKRGERYKVGKIFFIHKAKIFNIKKISDRTQVVEKIAKQIFTSKEDITTQMKYLLEFVEYSQEFYNLYFAKDKQKMIELISKT